MQRLAKEISTDLQLQHNNDWESGAGWGAAVSAPYKTRRYFSKEDSAEITRQAQAIIKAWAKKLRGIPAKKRFNENRVFWQDEILVPELQGGTQTHFADAGNAECRIEGIRVPYPTAEDKDGEKAGRWAIYVQPIYIDARSSRRCVKPRPDNPQSFRLKLNCASKEEWLWCEPEPYGRVDSELHWDKDREQFYCVYVDQAKTEPIPQSRRGRRWCRTKKRKEFNDACKALQRKLMEAGVVICGVRNRWERNAYVDCLLPGFVTDPEKGV